MLIISVVTLICQILARITHYPVWNLFFMWSLIVFLGTAVKGLYALFCTKRTPKEEHFTWLSRSWDIFQTFVFITFTRLFFRSGSNLDPALANEQAWNTAKNMVNQIGGAWDLALVPKMAFEHRAVLIIFVLGMVIHWLPERFKRRYRVVFSRLPLGWMAALVVFLILFIYQFITADLQSFIYFQF
jgi:hypothetical protein